MNQPRKTDWVATKQAVAAPKKPAYISANYAVIDKVGEDPESKKFIDELRQLGHLVKSGTVHLVDDTTQIDMAMAWGRAERALYEMQLFAHIGAAYSEVDGVAGRANDRFLEAVKEMKQLVKPEHHAAYALFDDAHAYKASEHWWKTMSNAAIEVHKKMSGPASAPSPAA